ncbi:hypothetical protein Tco_0627731 [Tanacetum coccineum]|uniref:CCHC-type domain-containing protein n=1 Tax=Tanacetum coccineum TaxID=301880 RepID=A0ABQ4WNA0_9ASTR
MESTFFSLLMKAHSRWDNAKMRLLQDRLRADICVMNILLQGLPRDIYKLINHNTDAKDIWDNVKMLLEGSELTKDDHESHLYDEFEHFGQHKGENIHDYYGRFVMAVKLNRGFKESNHDQLYAYLKQHELHANENKMLIERLNQHSQDPLALVSNVSPYHYPSSSSVPPQSSYTLPLTYQPYFADNTHLDTGNGGAQNRSGNVNAGQGKPIKYHNCNGIGHIARNCNQPKRPQNSDYFKEKMLLMQAQENGVDLDEDQLLFLVANQCDTFDSDVDEAPTAQTMFMANLSSAEPIYDEVGPSYDSDTLSEVQDHANCLDNMNKYHEEHEMQNDVQSNNVVDSNTEYTSNSNIILYEQYVQDNEEQVVKSDVSSVPNDAIMIITNDVYEQDTQCVTSNQPNKTVNASLTAELARYKELAEVYEKMAQFELTE